MADFILENSSLVELVAEVRWRLKPLRSTPGALIDPFYEEFTSRFCDSLEMHGYASVEPLYENDFPIEFIPNKPTLRIRKSPKTWPLFQIGPGIIAINTIPPYQGWVDFLPKLSIGLDGLFASYPFSAESLTITHVELKYINAFTKRLGLKRYDDFLAEHLGLGIPFSSSIIHTRADMKREVFGSLESRFQIAGGENDTGRLKVYPGKSRGENAVILEISNRRLGKQMSKVEIVEWYKVAHSRMREWFLGVTSQELQERMGPRKYVERTAP